MHPKSPKLLEDIERSCRYIIEDTAGMPVEAYLQQRLVRQAVERNLEIIGEALGRLRDSDPGTTVGISDVHRIIGLRNRLAHGYDDEIDDALIWQVTQESVPGLRDEIAHLLSEM
jgi:uncharacterized protein with HEPN domain